MPGRYIATGLYSEVVVNRGSTVIHYIIIIHTHFFLRRRTLYSTNASDVIAGEEMLHTDLT